MTRQLIIDGIDFTHTLTAGQVTQLFRVDRKTVLRWAREGRLATIRTLGGHHRFSRTQIETLLRTSATKASCPNQGTERLETRST